MTKTTAPLLLALVLLPCQGFASSRQIEGVDFAVEHRRGEVTLELQCLGLLRYRVFFRGYVAGLYLPPGVDPESALDDVPKRLELSYFWEIPGRAFGPAAAEVLAANLDAATLSRLRPRLDRIDALYENVVPGDRYSLTYVPGIGTELALNGAVKGVVDGADFAAAYFSIWLGENPIDQSLREQLTRCS